MNASLKKMNVAVLFGGRSAEHEISIITALQAISAIDSLLFNPIPVYVHPSGKWYTGDALLEKAFYLKLPEGLSQVQEVTLLPDPSIQGLLPVQSARRFGERIPVDVYLLAFHGQYGEDGCIQGLLELAGAAYTGCEVLPAAVAMNKFVCKGFLSSHGIPVLPSTVVSRREAAADMGSVRRRIRSTPGLERFPLFVKPGNLGSSVGISIANNEQELDGSLAKAFRYDEEALIEPCITKLMEINVSVMDGHSPTASVVEMPIASGKALTYEDKYLRDGGKKTGSSGQGMASLSRVIDPPGLDPELKKLAQDYALKAFRLLKGSGVGRFDFIVDLESNRLYFNEFNAIPGSFAFYLWQKSSPPLVYTQVLDGMIERAIERRSEKMALQREIGFKALR
jgi:D-alanine-D-alanine ligase